MSLPETRLKHPFSMSDVRLKANEDIVYQNSRVTRKGVFSKIFYPRARRNAARIIARNPAMDRRSGIWAKNRNPNAAAKRIPE